MFSSKAFSSRFICSWVTLRRLSRFAREGLTDVPPETAPEEVDGEPKSRVGVWLIEAAAAAADAEADAGPIYGPFTEVPAELDAIADAAADLGVVSLNDEANLSCSILPFCFFGVCGEVSPGASAISPREGLFICDAEDIPRCILGLVIIRRIPGRTGVGCWFGKYVCV